MADVIDMPGIKIFEGSDKERVQAFLAEVHKLQDRFDCVLIPQISFMGTEIQSNIVAIAKPRVPVSNMN